MITVRRGKERGFFDHGWLKTHHSFSFGDYYDPKHMRHRVLRVINEDFIGGGRGFGLHGHRDMEIVTYVISGTLEHRDSLGNVGTIRAGEIQRMTAGSGIEHGESNPDPKIECHLLQIWLLPDKKGLTPSWEQVLWRSQPVQDNGLRLLVSPTGGRESVKINQDAFIWHGDLKKDQTIQLNITAIRGGWLQLVKGSVTVNTATSIVSGDGLAVDGPEQLEIQCNSDSEFLWFDLP